MTDAEKIIVVTGVGVVSPYGMGLDKLQDGLLSGKSCLERDQQVFAGFDGSMAWVGKLHGELPELTAGFGPQYSRTDRLAMLAAKDAIADFEPDQARLRESGIVIASTVAGLTEIDPGIIENPTAWYRRGGLIPASSYSIARVAASVGEYLGIHGPTCATSVACASGATSIALAANLLLDGTAPMVLAGGSDGLCAFTASGFNALRSLDPDPCRPFDINRKGLNLGEGAAVLAMETLATARARGANVLAVLRGWAMGNDASHPTAPQKDGLGIIQCIHNALKMAGASAHEIDYVNAHGTGTPLNDSAEANAYESVFSGRHQPVPISSTKSYFGHCLGTAGSIEAAITITAIRSGSIFPTLRLTDPIPGSNVDWVHGPVRRQPVSLAMSVSVGFGGSNAVLIFGSANA
jgi:3-oxoacyl-[acyl-carrier-protein] synthase II